MIGTVAGTPGTLPTNWNRSVLTGFAQTIVGTGTENGLPYIDIRLFGQGTTGALDIIMETATSVPFATGDTAVPSAYISLVGGSLANITAVILLIREANAGGGNIAVRTAVSFTPNGVQTRYFGKVILPDLAVAFAHPRFQITVADSVPVDVTFRIAAPMFENTLGGPNSFVPTSNAAVTASGASLARSVGAIRSAITTPVTNLVRQVGKFISVPTAPISTLFRSIGRPVQAFTSPLASLRRAVGRGIQASTSPLATLRRAMSPAGIGQAVVSVVASLRRVTNLSIRQASTAPISSLTRTSSRSAPATTSPVATDVRVTGKRAQAITAPVGSVARSSLRSFFATTAPVATLQRVTALLRSASAAAVASLSRTTAKPLQAQAAAQATAAKGSMIAVHASTAPQASLAKVLGLTRQAIAATVASMTKRLFHLPDECSIVTLPAQETVIMFESCELQTGQFPARFTPESRLYGVDFSRRLDGSEVIAVPNVTRMDGDIEISDIYNNDTVVTFRLSGGSPIYQRLAISVTTTATPPNVYQGEATIACYP